MELHFQTMCKWILFYYLLYIEVWLILWGEKQPWIPIHLNLGRESPSVRLDLPINQAQYDPWPVEQNFEFRKSKNLFVANYFKSTTKKLSRLQYTRKIHLFSWGLARLQLTQKRDRQMGVTWAELASSWSSKQCIHVCCCTRAEKYFLYM